MQKVKANHIRERGKSADSIDEGKILKFDAEKKK
jgi:hypothetical protein